MPRYRKKPVEVDAIQFTVENYNRLIDEGWLDGGSRSLMLGRIDTLEGTMTANLGDWIIRGVKGERYPCKPDIFEVTYELVT